MVMRIAYGASRAPSTPTRATDYNALPRPHAAERTVSQLAAATHCADEVADGVGARERERALLDRHVDLGRALVLAHVLAPRRRAERLHEEPGLRRRPRRAPSAARRRGGGSPDRSFIAATNASACSSATTYSIETRTGPSSSSTSATTTGSTQLPAGSGSGPAPAGNASDPPEHDRRHERERRDQQRRAQRRVRDEAPQHAADGEPELEGQQPRRDRAPADPRGRDHLRGGQQAGHHGDPCDASDDEDAAASSGVVTTAEGREHACDNEAPGRGETVVAEPRLQARQHRGARHGAGADARHQKPERRRVQAQAPTVTTGSSAHSAPPNSTNSAVRAITSATAPRSARSARPARTAAPMRSGRAGAVPRGP